MFRGVLNLGIWGSGFEIAGFLGFSSKVSRGRQHWVLIKGGSWRFMGLNKYSYMHLKWGYK